jgi:hypothetical protein
MLHPLGAGETNYVAQLNEILKYWVFSEKVWPEPKWTPQALDTDSSKRVDQLHYLAGFRMVRLFVRRNDESNVGNDVQQQNANFVNDDADEAQCIELFGREMEPTPPQAVNSLAGERDRQELN